MRLRPTGPVRAGAAAETASPRSGESTVSPACAGDAQGDTRERIGLGLGLGMRSVACARLMNASSSRRPRAALDRSRTVLAVASATAKMTGISLAALRRAAGETASAVSIARSISIANALSIGTVIVLEVIDLVLHISRAANPVAASGPGTRESTHDGWGEVSDASEEHSVRAGCCGNHRRCARDGRIAAYVVAATSGRRAHDPLRPVLAGHVRSHEEAALPRQVAPSLGLAPRSAAP